MHIIKSVSVLDHTVQDFCPLLSDAHNPIVLILNINQIEIVEHVEASIKSWDNYCSVKINKEKPSQKFQ
jgi:hypothetical protein